MKIFREWHKSRKLVFAQLRGITHKIKHFKNLQSQLYFNHPSFNLTKTKVNNKSIPRYSFIRYKYILIIVINQEQKFVLVSKAFDKLRSFKILADKSKSAALFIRLLSIEMDKFRAIVRCSSQTFCFFSSLFVY